MIHLYWLSVFVCLFIFVTVSHEYPILFGPNCHIYCIVCGEEGDFDFGADQRKVGVKVRVGCGCDL